ncbi:hypothetical protein FQ017_04575 [Flagellimonas pelagia]|uniref:Uncharacterized protein n=2 Tax=Flagellimonas pelagia TaxID=2306998 RepID=A0A3A1NLV1_9FLAO|nr:hypothetical protein D2V05_04610 [Allomuricauda maritima]TXJ98626.1 hypothetical protein FQ017_04575 [Allomuricauda maritima]
MSKKSTIRKRFIIEGAIALFIAISPIMFYSYKYLPQDATTLTILGITVNENNFGDVSTAIYFYLSKVVPLLLLVIWFVTSKNWWYHAILIPISMYSFQLFTVLNYSNSERIDENEILYVIAVTMVVVPVVYFIRLKLVDKHVHGIDLDAMDTELQILKEKEELRKEREKLEERQNTLSKKM